MQSGRRQLDFSIDAQLDQSIDQGAGAPPGMLTELINLRKSADGRLVKRPGMIATANPGSADWVRLIPHRNAFASVDGVGIIRSYAEGVNKWKDKDYTPRWALTGAQVMVQNPTAALNYGGCVSGSGVTVHVYADTTDKSIKSVTVDETNGAILRAPEIIAIIATGAGETDMPIARITSDGTRIWVAVQVVAATIKCEIIATTWANIVGLGSWPARTALGIVLDDTDPGFDLTVNTSMAVVAHNSVLVGVRKLQVKTINSTPAIVDSYTVDLGVRAVSCWSEPGNSWIWVHYAIAAAPATTGVRVFSTALVLKQTGGGADQGVGNVGSTTIGKYGSASVMLASTSTTTATSPWGAIVYRTDSFDGVSTLTLGGDLWSYGCNLASAPFKDANDVYVWVDFKTNVQSDSATLLVALTHNGGTMYSNSLSFVASLFPHLRVAGGRTAAGTYRSNYYAPQKVYPSSQDANSYVWDGAFAVGPIFPASIKEYRIQRAASTVNAAMVPTELQGLTLCTGGVQGFCFDGEHFTELGFVSSPAETDVYVAISGAGGSIAAGSYQWAVTYEYTDAAGNRHQSGPGLSLARTLTGSTSKATLTLQTLRHTTKQDRDFTDAAVQIVVWRTLATDPLQFHRVDSVKNDPEVTAVSFVDTHIDADISAHEILYTSRGELANEMPPPLWHATVLGGKLAGIDAEYRNRIVFSKPLVLERGPEFSSANETFVNGIGPLTALAEMDGTLYAFSATSIAAAAWGDGVDATGQGAWPQPEIISRAAGCVDPRALCVTQDGIVFVSGRSSKLNTLKIWLLPRGGGNIVEIGKKVRSYLNYSSILSTRSLITGVMTVVAILNYEDQGRVVIHFHTDEGESFALEYDYINRTADGVGSWNATYGTIYDTLGGVASACIANGKHRIAANQGVYTASDTVFSDGAEFIPYIIRTHTIKPTKAPFGKVNAVNVTFQANGTNGGVEMTLSDDDFFAETHQTTFPFTVAAGDRQQRYWQPPTVRSYKALGYGLQFESLLRAGGEGTPQDSQDVIPLAVTFDYVTLPGTHRAQASERV